VSGSGGRLWFFFKWGDIGDGKTRKIGTWSSIYVHFMSCLRTSQNLCTYVLYYIILYVLGVVLSWNSP
jgi:hypothetical protein